MSTAWESLEKQPEGSVFTHEISLNLLDGEVILFLGDTLISLLADALLRDSGNVSLETQSFFQLPLGSLEPFVALTAAEDLIKLQEAGPLETAIGRI